MVGKQGFNLFVGLAEVDENVGVVFVFGEFFYDVTFPHTTGTINQKRRCAIA